MRDKYFHVVYLHFESKGFTYKHSYTALIRQEEKQSSLNVNCTQRKIYTKLIMKE